MQPKTFILQLHYMLSDKSLEPWIRWSDENEHIFCLKPYDPEFPSRVLKKNFKHGNVSSFVRQLHMYGFHKLQTGPSGTHVNGGSGSSTSTGGITSSDNEPPTHIIKSNKESMMWYFTHPSGYFYKDAGQPDLARIQRKSNGVGKDGKRKNGLSPVCISILDPSARASTPPMTTATGSANLESLSRYSVSQAYTSSTLEPMTAQQVAHEAQSMYNSVPKRKSTPSLDMLIHHPQNGPIQALSMASGMSNSSGLHSQQHVQSGLTFPTAHRTSPALPQQLHPSHSHPTLRPSILNPAPQHPAVSGASPSVQTYFNPASTVTPASPAMDYNQFESNIQMLQKCILTIVDILQAPPSQQQTVSKLQNLNNLKSELLAMDSKWSGLQYYNSYNASSTNSSLSSDVSVFNPPSSVAGTSTTSIHSQPGQESRYSSMSTQKNSIFSNPRLSNINSSLSAPSFNTSGNMSSQYGGVGQQDTKVPLPVFPPLQQQVQYTNHAHQNHTSHLTTQSQGSNILQ